MESTELMTVQQDLYVAPVVPLEEAKAKFQQVRKYTADCLTKGIDYGSFDGVPRPSLMKPGAEKIGSLFGLAPRFECVDKVLNFNGDGNPENEPFFYFEYRCNLYKGEQFVGSCDGSCNSWEKKYRYRQGGLKCPVCGKPLRKSKNGDGYYCWAKKGGCGAKFASNDPKITSQSAESVKNFDTADQVNTFQKMAQKRAYVGAIIIACNLSEYFTQDLEDMDDMVPADIVDGDFRQVDQKSAAEQPKRQWDEDAFLRSFTIPAGVPNIDLRAAETYTDSKDRPYKDMGVRELYSHWCGLAKRIREENPAEAEITGLKIGAICRLIQTAKERKFGEQ